MMLLRVWRFGTILLVTISTGAALGHLLEMPGKLKADAALWLTMLQTIYPPAFGPVSGTAEGLAVVAAIVLVLLVRRRRRSPPAAAAVRWTLIAAVCMVVAHAAFWFVVSPVNATLVPLTPDTLPPDWTRLRDRWEYAHAARAVLQVIALMSLVLSLLVEIPTDAPAGDEGQERAAPASA